MGHGQAGQIQLAALRLVALAQRSKLDTVQIHPRKEREEDAKAHLKEKHRATMGPVQQKVEYTVPSNGNERAISHLP